MLRKKRNEKKLAIAQTVFRSDRFFLPLLGANQRGPIEPMFDRFAMRTTRDWMRASNRAPGVVMTTTRYNENIAEQCKENGLSVRVLIRTTRNLHG